MRGGNEMEKTGTLTGKKEGEVMNTRRKNGQKLGKRNEKAVKGKRGNAVSGGITPHIKMQRRDVI